MVVSSLAATLRNSSNLQSRAAAMSNWIAAKQCITTTQLWRHYWRNLHVLGWCSSRLPRNVCELEYMTCTLASPPSARSLVRPRAPAHAVHAGHDATQPRSSCGAYTVVSNTSSDIVTPRTPTTSSARSHSSSLCCEPRLRVIIGDAAAAGSSFDARVSLLRPPVALTHGSVHTTAALNPRTLNPNPSPRRRHFMSLIMFPHEGARCRNILLLLHQIP